MIRQHLRSAIQEGFEGYLGVQDDLIPHDRAAVLLRRDVYINAVSH